MVTPALRQTMATVEAWAPAFCDAQAALALAAEGAELAPDERETLEGLREVAATLRGALKVPRAGAPRAPMPRARKVVASAVPPQL